MRRFFTKNITFKLNISNHTLTSNIKKVKGSATYNIEIICILSIFGLNTTYLSMIFVDATRWPTFSARFRFYNSFLFIFEKQVLFALNLFAFTNFTRPELTVGIIMFTLATMCKLYRNSKCQKTYPFYTTIWHIGCVVLLVLASRSINRLSGVLLWYKIVYLHSIFEYLFIPSFL